jgi:hypothetical protein
MPKKNSKKINKKYCTHQDCNKYSSYGYPGLGRKGILYCNSHKENGMINLHHKRCEHENCNKIPSFNFQDLPAKYCSEHKLEGMINKNKICKFKGCNKRSYYGFKGKKCIYCSKHKLEGMVPGKILCEFEGCCISANFGILGGQVEFCFKHKKENMIDITSKKCIYSGCNKRACFGKINELALYCLKHKEDDMINIKTKSCKFKDCESKAIYGYPNGSKEFCSQHKLNGMVSNFKKCSNVNCKKRAYFSNINDDKIQFCADHKLDGMINKNLPKCIEENCNLRAYYGKLFLKKIHCKLHKEKNEYANHNPKCLNKNCKKRPLYSETNFPKRCETHKLDTDSNIIEKECNNCKLKYFINNNIGLCDYCFDFGVNKNYLQKQNHTINFLQNNFDLKPILIDKTIDTNCSLRRPDLVYDLKYLNLIIEIDEDQHKSRACQCEQLRMIEIHQSFGGIPVLFIRFNPDNYLDNNGKKIKDDNINKRYRLLLETIKGIQNKLIHEQNWTIPLSVIYLFYDGYDKDNTQEIQIIDYFNLQVDDLKI